MVNLLKPRSLASLVALLSAYQPAVAEEALENTATVEGVQSYLDPCSVRVESVYTSFIFATSAFQSAEL